MIVDLTEEYARHVIENLRETDRKQAELFMTDTRVDALVQNALTAYGLRYALLTKDGEPAVIAGINFFTAGTGLAWMSTTDRVHEVVLELTRAIKQAICNVLRTHLHRVEMVTPLLYEDEARRWLAMIGLKYEYTLKQYGRDGEDFYLYARTRMS